MKEYGVSASFSMIENADGVQAGMHFADTEDLDIDVSVEGENREEVLQALAQEVMEDVIEQTLCAAEDEEEEVDSILEMSYEALQDENAQLRDEIEFLRERLDEAWNDDEDDDDEDARLDNISDKKGNQSIDDYFFNYDINPDALKLFYKMFGVI